MTTERQTVLDIIIFIVTPGAALLHLKFQLKLLSEEMSADIWRGLFEINKK